MDSNHRSDDAAEQGWLQMALLDGLYILPADLADPLPQQTESFGEQLTHHLVLTVALLMICVILVLR